MNCLKCKATISKGKHCEKCCKAIVAQRRRTRNNSNGKCYCGKPLFEDRLSCKHCLDNMSAAVKIRQQKRLLNKECVRCGDKLEENYTLRRCVKCSEKAKQHCKSLRTKWSQEGKCVKCGSSNADYYCCNTCFLRNASTKYFKTVTRWKELEELLIKQNHQCVYTGITLVLGDNASLDHIIPRSKGGINDLTNLQWIDRTVNRMKSDIDEPIFVEFVKKIYQYTRENHEKL